MDIIGEMLGARGAGADAGESPDEGEECEHDKPNMGIIGQVFDERDARKRRGRRK
jgi:hypothetical protein